MKHRYPKRTRKLRNIARRIADAGCFAITIHGDRKVLELPDFIALEEYLRRHVAALAMDAGDDDAQGGEPGAAAPPWGESLVVAPAPDADGGGGGA